MEIKNYSCYDNYTVVADTENISSIVDKLIRLTAKITEQYAGDIIYDINTLRNNMANHKAYDKVLFFRESGVWVVDVEKLEHYIADSEDIQAWRLTFDPSTVTTTLIRISIKRGNR